MAAINWRAYRTSYFLYKKVCQINPHNKKDEAVPRDALRSKGSVVLSLWVGVPRRC